MDLDIAPGLPWERQLVTQLDSARAALLLVSPAFLESRYVREIELPTFMKRMEADNFHLFWILLEDCNWKTVAELRGIQLLGDIKTPIGACPTRSDEQCRLIDAVETISRKMASPQP